MPNKDTYIYTYILNWMKHEIFIPPVEITVIKQNHLSLVICMMISDRKSNP